MAKSTKAPGELLTVAEVAAKTKMSAKTIRRAIAALEIAVTRIGANVRISEAAYDDWVRRNTTDPVL